MTTRAQNERRFGGWVDLAGGGRRYAFEVVGHRGWKARYLKEVDEKENIVRFWQEIHDERGTLVEIHEKYPIDKGHRQL